MNLFYPWQSLPTGQIPASAQQWVVLVVAAAATIFVLFRSKGRTKKKDPLERGPFQNSLAQQRSVERQMQNLLVELSEMARQITASLDTRAARLDLLIREADEKIAQLRSLAVRTPAMNGTSVEAASPVETPPSAYEADPRHAAVYALADEGRSPAEIAEQLNRPNGEIQLILALRPRA